MSLKFKWQGFIYISWLLNLSLWNMTVALTKPGVIFVLLCFFLLFRKLCEFRARCEVQQVSHVLSCFWMGNRYTEIWVNLFCTWERHELLGSFLKSALITGYHFSSAQWQLTSWCGFRQGMVLMLGTSGSPPGDIFTVTLVWQGATTGECLTICCLLSSLKLNKRAFFDKKKKKKVLKLGCSSC